MQHRSRTELVAIQPHGFKPPLILLPSNTGETCYAHHMAGHRGRDRPVWGAPPSDRMSECERHVPLEERTRVMSTTYVLFKRAVAFDLQATLLLASLLMKQPANWSTGVAR
jgi:hypothetical protein